MGRVTDSVLDPDTKRMPFRPLMRLLSESIASYWPRRTVGHPHRRHGLEALHDEKAAQWAQPALGGTGDLPSELLPDDVRSGWTHFAARPDWARFGPGAAG